MESKAKIKLTPEQIDLLSQYPEQGMGYQIVDIKLKNGHLLQGKLVFNSTYLQIEKEEVIDPAEIDTIKISEKS